MSTMEIIGNGLLAPASGTPPRVEILRDPRPPSAEMDAAWRALVDQSTVPDTVRQGPQFFRHLHAIGAPTALAVLRDAGAVIGLAPLQIGTTRLEFGARRYNLWTVRLRSLDLLGSQPLGPETPTYYDGLIRTLFDAFPAVQAIRLAGLPTDCAFSIHVRHSQAVQRLAHLYSVRGERLCHVAQLPPSWPAYLALLGKKRRHEVERQIRRAREHGGGVLKLARIETVAQLGELESALEGLGVRLTPNRAVGGGGRAELASLAAHGLFLGYVLYCGITPCAVALGLQDRNRYHMDSLHTGLLPPQLSPGSCLRHLVSEDLIQSGIAQIDYGFGEPKYSYSSINTTHPRIALLLLRKNLANRLLCASHHVFQAGIDALRRRRNASAQKERQQ
ncbi:MAG: GNAT family N-acetyltransferase [Planctomycetaceae bacterium]|nr:GNAT family N-acetyltransferase [Planctomycetaceae bacterium]